jgi:hypothetical protein
VAHANREYIECAQTYLLDGRQHVLVAVGDTIYDFLIVLEKNPSPKEPVPVIQTKRTRGDHERMWNGGHGENI